MSRRPCHTAARFQGPRCPHCKVYKASAKRRGNLCLRCSMTPAIRDRYPFSPRFVAGNGVGKSGLVSAEAIPCPWPPGTVERLEVLAARALAGQPLFQPGDATDWSDRPWATSLPPSPH